MKSIYVACMQRNGKRTWIWNPKPFFDGRVCVWFTASTPMAGIITDIFKSKANPDWFKETLQDDLDRLRLPWIGSAGTKGRFGMKVLEGNAIELFMMTFELTGPLPVEVADRIEGSRVKKPGVKIMSRFGG